MLKIKAGIMRVLSIVIIFLFAFMTVIGTYQIVTRYFFNKPSTVSEELLTYSFTWMALLASAYVFGKRDHMRMGFLAYRHQDRTQADLCGRVSRFHDTHSFATALYGVLCNQNCCLSQQTD